MRALRAVIVLAAACGDERTSSVEQAATSCGAYTHEESGTCVPDRFVILAPQKIVADGTPVRVAAVGHNPDGTPSTEEVVLNIDRAGAGEFPEPVLTLDARTSETSFVPCKAAVPGCIGPLQLTLALVAAPTQPVARLAVELVDAPAIGSVDQCNTGGNALHLESKDFIYPGALSVANATFSLMGGSQRAMVEIVPADATQGARWTLDFSTVQLAAPLAAGVYVDAYQVPPVGKPGLAVAGTGPYSECTFTYHGDFQIHAYQPTVSLTASFRQHCGNKVVEGCVHITN